MTELVSRLQSGELLLMDGAMGTEMQRRRPAPYFTSSATDNLAEPAFVRTIHADYLGVGAEVLLTNTFLANPESFDPGKLETIWQAAIDLARRHPVPHFVLADVGPVRELTDAFLTMLRSVTNLADGILLETWSSVTMLREVASRLDTALPLLVSFTFQSSDGLTTFTGDSPETCAQHAKKAGVAAIGVNCGRDIGFDAMLEIVRRYRQECDLPIFARPNAGTPIRGAAGWEYAMTPTQFAAGVEALFKSGVVMAGGCCGTTPEHIRELAKRMKMARR